eukprot:jgi/Botrbrau1/5748/Bobra.0134s0022.1
MFFLWAGLGHICLCKYVFGHMGDLLLQEAPSLPCVSPSAVKPNTNVCNLQQPCCNPNVSGGPNNGSLECCLWRHHLRRMGFWKREPKPLWL